MKSNKYVVTSLLIVVMMLAGCTATSQLNNAINSSLSTAANAVSAVASSSTQTPAANTETSIPPTLQPTTTTSDAPTAVPLTLSPVPANLASMESTYEQIYNQVNPSVVYIEVVEQSSSSGLGGNPFGFGQQTPAMASGSGFVWDMQGHIVTNDHVVAGTSSINVTFSDGLTVPAKIVGQDPNADLAVIQVRVDSSELHPVTVGDSNQIQVGQIVLAIGNPYGLVGSMSEGIISGLSRTIPAETSSLNSNSSATYNIPDIIQTDAAINPGNSGGVLLNLNGQVIGVTAAIESNSNSNAGIGFVIPSNIVTKVVPSLISTGTYAHPWLGVTGITLTPAMASAMNLPSNQRGALIIDIASGGPASAAGLQPSNNTAVINGVQEPVGGDVITAVNDQSIQSFEDLGSYLFLNTKPGDTVTLTVIRNGKEVSAKVTLGTLPNS